MERNESSEDSVFRWVAVCEVMHSQTQGYIQAMMARGTLPQFVFSDYYLLISGLRRQVYRRFFNMEAFDYTAHFRTVEYEIYTTLEAKGVRCITTMLLYDHTKRFAMIFATPKNISAQEVAQTVADCFDRLYARIFDMTRTPYCNYTVLSRRLDGYEQLHPTFHEIDELSRQQFFDMREMIMTPSLLEASRREADRDQLHEDLMLMFAAMRSGDGQESQERYRAVMAQLGAARDFRLLKDALSAIHTTLGGILRSRGMEVAPQDREAFLVSSYPTFALLERGVGEKLLFYRRQISDMSPMSELIQEAVRYIRHHCAEDIAVADIAAHIGMSESWLTKRFKQECGKNIVAYLLDVRVQKAKTLLVETDKLIQEIACAVGFENPGYFISVFRRVVGVTPKAYRQQMRGEE